MTPEAAAFLRKSQEFLRKAQSMLEQGWADEAGRAAYLAGFHAAQALLYDRFGRTLKTHGGVQSEFAKLVKDDPKFGVEARGFLGRTYNLKSFADYETSLGAAVTAERAAKAIQESNDFVALITSMLS